MANSKLESQVVQLCRKWLKTQGWEPITLFTGGIQTARVMVKNPAKGIPDSLNFHIETKRMLWIEYKREKGGKVSPEQAIWHLYLRTCGQIVFVVNSVESLKKQMEEIYGTK